MLKTSRKVTERKIIATRIRSYSVSTHSSSRPLAPEVVTSKLIDQGRAEGELVDVAVLQLVTVMVEKPRVHDRAVPHVEEEREPPAR